MTDRRARATRRSPLLLAAILLLSAPSLAADKLVAVLDARPGSAAHSPAPVVYWHEVWKEPRPLQIHCLRVDLTAKDSELVALITAAPDGAGRAEATLEKPETLAARPGIIAAVNTNAFGIVPGATVERPAGGPRYFRGAFANICGWAKDETRQASPPESPYSSFWMDATGCGHIGTPTAPAEARMAAAGFGELVREEQIVNTDDKPLHPRTAVGLDAGGRTLWLVVVDGRQSGYSEGMALRELAALMKDLGCASALNLDGGGSSIMLLAKTEEKLSIVNRPSEPGTRPIPIMLGIRRRPR